MQTKKTADFVGRLKFHPICSMNYVQGDIDK